MAVSNVELRVDARNALNGLRQVNSATTQLDGAISQLQRSLGGLAASFVGGFALSRIISDVKELDTNLRRLGTVGGDVGALDKGLGQLSKNLEGISSKAELASASYQALSAGFTDTAGNIKIVEAATKAAIGGLANTTEVTAVLTKTLNAYNLSGSQAIKVTDSISKAVEFGQVEWSDYTTQLGRVASIAAIAGVSLDEVNAFVAAATKNGATAEIAFTGLGATLNTLLQPTKESRDAAAQLGIQWNLAGLKGKGFSGLIAELALKTGTNQEAAVRLLGSQEALRGAFAAAAKGGKDYKDALEAIGGAAGKTDSDFKILKDSLENQLKALDTAFKNLSEALGRAFGPTVVDTIGDVTGAINNFADLINAIPQPVATAVAEIVKFVAQALLLQKAIQGIIALRAGLIGVLTATTTSVTITGTASATATPLVNGLAAALRNLALIGVVTVGVNYVSNVVGEALSLQELQKRRERGGAAGEFKGASRETVVAAQQAQRKELERLKKQDEQRRKKLGQNPLYNIPLVGPLAISAMSPFIAGEQQKIGERAQFAQGVLGLDPNKFPSAAKPPATVTGDGGVTGMGDTTKKKKGKTDAEQAAKQIADAQSILRLSQSQFDIEGRILEARAQNNDTLVITRTAQKELAGIANEIANVQANKELPDAAKKAQIADLELKAKGVSRQLAFDIANAEKDKVKNAAEGLQKLQDEQALLQARLAGNEAEVILAQQIRDIKAQYPGLNEADIKSTLEKINVLKQQISAAEQLKQLYTDIGTSIKSGVVDAIQGAIDGTKSLQEVASSLLKSIANTLLNVAVNLALFGAISGTGTGGGLLGAFFKPRAKGGSVMGGQPYLVGERGPELFMPGRSGGIAPTGSFGGGANIVVNVDASGSKVQGDQGQGAALGRAVSQAVQAELIKQKRPGGLLA